MAICLAHRQIIRELSRRGVLPRGGALLEIGEANWHGTLESWEVFDDIRTFVQDPVRRVELNRRFAEIVECMPPSAAFDVVKVFYDIFLQPSSTESIDLHGSPAAIRLDLNGSVDLGRRFDVVINHGTAEHIFNIARVFKTIHDHTEVDGVMIHESPFTGWIEHGFYNLQPTLYFDLAEANRYTMAGMFIEAVDQPVVIPVRSREDIYNLASARKIPENSQLLTVLRRGDDQLPFQVPMQGYYRGALPARGMAAWSELR